MTLAADRPSILRSGFRRTTPLPAGWPLVVLLGGFPVFWALGMPNLAVTIMAVPMAVHLLTHRPIRLPHGFLLWALFLTWSLVAVLMLGVDPPGTIPDSASGRLIGWGFRELSYVSVTVVLLYIGNLTEEEFPQRRLVRLLGWFFVWAVCGGVLGMLLPYFEFTSPFEMILPQSIRSNPYVNQLVHPTAAQVQELLGGETPRPAAPFGYTNTWGYHITVLAVWFVAGWVIGRRASSKLIAISILLVGGVVLIYSLNRAAWIGALLAVAYVVIRLALHQRLLPLLGTLLAAAVAVLVFFASPLHQVVEARAADGKSNDIRSFTTERALELSAQSPIIGYGSTRAAVGSSSSIAVGKSAECPQCGNVSIGINGYLYMLLMSTGWVGAFLFFAFGSVQVWRVRGDPSPIVAAGITVLLMTAFYAFFYDISTWFLVPFVTLGILWREDQRRQQEST